jgi:two-component system, OmpR family, phosphate regulon response regulator PhoB
MAKVIVVDDDHSTTTLVRMLLEMEGFEVATSPNNQQALAVASQEIAVFIIDCNLAHGESGLDLLRAIRQGETGAASDVATILVSGDQRLEQETLDAGASVFLVKPYSPVQLSETVRELIDGH